MLSIKKNRNIFYCDKKIFIFNFFQYNLCARLGVTNKKIQKFFIKTNFFIFLIFLILYSDLLSLTKESGNLFNPQLNFVF